MMPKLTTAYIGLGSNLGDRNRHIDKALKMLAEKVEIAGVSQLIETEPLAGFYQPEYLNAVAEIKTALSADDLLKTMTDIEDSLDRQRETKWSSRTIDLDILLFGSEVIKSSRLTIPHREMHLRSFVLKGLCELNCDLIHPVIKESVKELAERLSGADFVLDSDLPQLISIAGVIGVGKTTLTENLAGRLGCQQILEPYDENPYLSDVYAGKKDLALDSELYFLNARAEQLNLHMLQSGQVCVSDYVFDKSRIYAKYWLNGKELAAYENKFNPLAAKVARPVLVIYLADSIENCLQRIHKRNRPYEQDIKREFMETLSSDYEQLFANWKVCPVIRKKMSEFNCMNGSDIDNLTNQVKNYIAE